MSNHSSSSYSSKSPTGRRVPDINHDGTQKALKNPSKLKRAGTAVKSLISRKSHSDILSSSTESAQEVFSEANEHTLDYSAPQKVQDPAPSDPEVVGLLNELHRWDNKKLIIDPALWQQRVRLRRFRLFQRKQNRAQNRVDERFDGQIDQGHAYTGNCLLDAELFVHHPDVEDTAVLGKEDRQLYKDMYGLTPEEVRAARVHGIIIDAANKCGTLAVKESTNHLLLAGVRALVKALYQMLTDPVLEGWNESLYSKDFLEKVLQVKSMVDREFRYYARQDAEMHALTVDEQNEFIRTARRHRSNLESRRNSAASSRAGSQRESCSGVRPPSETSLNWRNRPPNLETRNSAAGSFRGVLK